MINYEIPARVHRFCYHTYTLALTVNRKRSGFRGSANTHIHWPFTVSRKSGGLNVFVNKYTLMRTVSRKRSGFNVFADPHMHLTPTVSRKRRGCQSLCYRVYDSMRRRVVSFNTAIRYIWVGVVFQGGWVAFARLRSMAMFTLYCFLVHFDIARPFRCISRLQGLPNLETQCKANLQRSQ